MDVSAIQNFNTLLGSVEKNIQFPTFGGRRFADGDKTYSYNDLLGMFMQAVVEKPNYSEKVEGKALLGRLVALNDTANNQLKEQNWFKRLLTAVRSFFTNFDRKGTLEKLEAKFQLTPAELKNQECEALGTKIGQTVSLEDLEKYKKLDAECDALAAKIGQPVPLKDLEKYKNLDAECDALAAKIGQPVPLKDLEKYKNLDAECDALAAKIGQPVPLKDLERYKQMYEEISHLSINTNFPEFIQGLGGLDACHTIHGWQI